MGDTVAVMDNGVVVHAAPCEEPRTTNRRRGLGLANVLNLTGGRWLVPALALMAAFLLIGSGSTWLTLTVAGAGHGYIIFIIARPDALVF